MQTTVRNAIRVLRGAFVFRLLIAAIAAIVLIVYRSELPPPEPVTRVAYGGLFLVPSLAGAIFLSIPGLDRRLGAKYLPAALGVAIVAFSLEYAPAYTQTGLQVIVTLSSGRQVSHFWAPTEALLLVLVPCVLGAAVYGVRGAVLSASLASVIHLAQGFGFWHSGMPLYGFLALLPLRLGVLFGFPIIAGYLADTRQREHAALQEANRRLRGYAATVEQLATSRERVRLARELHDTVAHTLSALVVQLEAVDALQGTDPDGAAEQLEKVRAQARAGLGETRRAILDLRSSPVEELGLVGALAQLAERWEVEFWSVGERVPLPTVRANALYRIAEEALTNAQRHADAGRIVLSLSYVDSDRLELAIEDDGRGFDPEAVGPERVGLTGIYERAALIGAQVTVASAPDRGTRLQVTLGID
jgi:signal transduction histidine kinase